MVTPTGYTALDLVGFTDKGPYSALENYVKNDLAHYAGSIWRCKIDDTTNVTPAENANWTVFVSDRSNLVEASIAPIETSPATAPHAQGSQLFYNDTLYKAKTAIAIGDSLVVDTNIEAAPNVTTQLEAKANTADLGTAAAKDSTNAVTSGSTDLVESGAVASELATKVSWDDYAQTGAVNLLPCKSATQVISDITYTVNSDGSVTASGTASAESVFFLVTKTGYGADLLEKLDPNKSYKLWTCISNTNMRLDFYNGSTYLSNVTASEDGTEFTIPSNATTMDVYIRTYNGTSVNATFYPMLTLASYNGDYVPYVKTNKELTDDIDTVSSQISDLETDIEAEIYNNIAGSDIITYGSEISSVVYTFVAKQGKRVSFTFTVYIGNADIAAYSNIFTINSAYRPKINYGGILHGVSSGEYMNAVCFVGANGSVTSNESLKANCRYRFVFDYITA